MVVSAVREQIPEGAEFQLATVLVHVMMPTTKAMKKKKTQKTHTFLLYKEGHVPAVVAGNSKSLLCLPPTRTAVSKE